LTQYLTVAQLKQLLTTGAGASKEVRKILFHFISKDGVFGLVAYGAKSNNEIVGDSIHLRTVAGADTVSVPEGSVLGDLELTRGQLKDIYGHAAGRRKPNVRLDEAMVTVGLRFTASSVNGDGNTAIFIVSKDPNVPFTYPFKRPMAGTVFLNPIPPARPCDTGDCDDF